MSKTRTCTNCGAVVPDGHFYCGRCGARYSGGEHSPNETMFFGAMQAPGRAKLILVKGEGLEGLSYHLNATEHVAGRNQGAILFPDDKYLSNKHASFVYRENILYLRDEGSHNGTYLKVEEPRELQNGDQFLIGDQLLRFEPLNLIPEYPTDDQTLIYISPAKEFKFRVMQILRGGRAGRSFSSVSNDVLIGREGCDINFSDDRQVSRKHARITWNGSGATLTDMESKNGTYFRITGEERLTHGAYVQIGAELMRVEING
jgi:pSer/pThr/pTyr-binding forkhead associated (FHA) protein